MRAQVSISRWMMKRLTGFVKRVAAAIHQEMKTCSHIRGTSVEAMIVNVFHVFYAFVIFVHLPKPRSTCPSTGDPSLFGRPNSQLASPSLHFELLSTSHRGRMDRRDSLLHGAQAARPHGFVVAQFLRCPDGMRKCLHISLTRRCRAFPACEPRSELNPSGDL